MQTEAKELGEERVSPQTRARTQTRARSVYERRERIVKRVSKRVSKYQVLMLCICVLWLAIEQEEEFGILCAINV